MKVGKHPLPDCLMASGGEPLRYFEERVQSILDYPNLKSPGPPCQAGGLVTLHLPEFQQQKDFCQRPRWRQHIPIPIFAFPAA